MTRSQCRRCEEERSQARLTPLPAATVPRGPFSIPPVMSPAIATMPDAVADLVEPLAGRKLIRHQSSSFAVRGTRPHSLSLGDAGERHFFAPTYAKATIDSAKAGWRLGWHAGTSSLDFARDNPSYVDGSLRPSRCCYCKTWCVNDSPTRP
jgi:hypothetical protein